MGTAVGVSVNGVLDGMTMAARKKGRAIASPTTKSPLWQLQATAWAATREFWID